MRRLSWSNQETRKVILRDVGPTDRFVAFDPGKSAAASFWAGGELVGIQQLTTRGDYSLAVSRMADEGFKVGIIELPYVGKNNAKSALRLSESRGYLLGRIDARVTVFTVIDVVSSTWQTVLSKEWLPGGASWDREARTIATRKLAETHQVYLQAQLASEERMAVASAIGIGSWWEKRRQA